MLHKYPHPCQYCSERGCFGHGKYSGKCTKHRIAELEATIERVRGLVTEYKIEIELENAAESILRQVVNEIENALDGKDSEVSDA